MDWLPSSSTRVKKRGKGVGRGLNPEGFKESKTLNEILFVPVFVVESNGQNDLVAAEVGL